jgi:acylphosphatase
MSQERRRVYYSGRVQGVGFRYTAHHLAQGFAVSGFVRNLDDGRVELLAEGEPAELVRFLDAIRGRFGGYIDDIQADRAPGEPSCRGFTIRTD